MKMTLCKEQEEFWARALASACRTELHVYIAVPVYRSRTELQFGSYMCMH